MLHHKIHSVAALGRGGDAHLRLPMASAADGGLLMIVGIMDRKYTAVRLKCCIDIPIIGWRIAIVIRKPFDRGFRVQRAQQSSSTVLTS